MESVRWINVNGKLPEVNTAGWSCHVLIHCGHGTIPIIAQYSDGTYMNKHTFKIGNKSYIAHWFDTSGSPIKENVTHWMPLPRLPEERMPKVYLSGPVSSRPIEEAREQFEAVENMLVQKGYEVINPFKKDMADDAPWEMHMAADLLLLSRCDYICMLDNRESSQGAKLEYEYAKRLGIRGMGYGKDCRER